MPDSPMDQSKRNVIIITPVKNEGSIIERFLACCSIFADRIILLDQESTDDTLSIAKRFPKVEIHANPDSNYNEQSRQRQLLMLARAVGGRHPLILALDADEIPTANILGSPEWASILQSPPGTVLLMPRLEILPGFEGVLVHNDWPFGYMDDGAEHGGESIHSVRIPMPQNRRDLVTSQLKVLHYSFVRPDLQAAKNRFYCVKENLTASRTLMDRRALYRYDFIENRTRIMKAEVFNAEWIAGYEKRGIDMTSILVERPNWFDKEEEGIVTTSGGIRYHFDPIWNRTYEVNGSAAKAFRLPPTGLGRVLMFLDRVYAAVPFKRPFAWAMECILKAYTSLRR